jgi:predicted nucleic acid-binding protein
VSCDAIGDIDTLIGATALVRDLTLVTNDTTFSACRASS